MKNVKALESLVSKKFNNKQLSQVIGGAPIYGTTRYTTSFGPGTNGGDYKVKTTNPDGYPEGTSGWDAVK
jgi:hypothetical protein